MVKMLMGRKVRYKNWHINDADKNAATQQKYKK